MADIAGQLGQNPAWLGYMRALGFETAADQAAANTREEGLAQRQQLAAPEIAYQGDLQRRAIDSSAEGRGIYNSGLRLRDLAQQEHGQQYKQAGLTLDTGEGIAEVQAQLGLQLAQLNRQGFETALALGGKDYTAAGTSPYASAPVVNSDGSVAAPG